MYEHIITDLFVDCTRNFDKSLENFLRNPTTIADFSISLHEALQKLGSSLFAEAMNLCDQFLRDSPVRKAKGWWIVGKRPKTLVTSYGEIQFTKTLFKNKNTGVECFLLDQLIGLRPKERMTDGAVARGLEEAVQSSCRRGGEAVSETAKVSKETIMQKIHLLEFPANGMVQGWCGQNGPFRGVLR